MGPTTLNPEEAISVQNKDEVFISLLTNTLPSAKKFKDAIVSLSPEQQQFAKACRAMQLESSVFGMCVIQLKPQLEKVLNMSPGSLAKEIQLTQDLMSLFIDYQISSDLLSLDGDSACEDRVNIVKEHVKSIVDVVGGEKKKHLKEEAMKADMRAKRSYEPECHMSNHPLDDDSQDSYRGIDMFGGYEVYEECEEACEDECDDDFEGDYFCDFGSSSPTTPVAGSTHSQLTEQIIATTRSDKPMPLNFTAIPKILDSKFEAYDNENSLRSATIKTGEVWSRKRKASLLTHVKLLRSILRPSIQRRRRLLIYWTLSVEVALSPLTARNSM